MMSLFPRITSYCSHLQHKSQGSWEERHKDQIVGNDGHCAEIADHLQLTHTCNKYGIPLGLIGSIQGMTLYRVCVLLDHLIHVPVYKDNG